jgi:hypothetical protein
MSFDLKVTTFIDYLFHYISKGACFSSEMLDVIKFEDAIFECSKQAIYSGAFMKFKPEEFAASILYTCRSEAKVIKVWNWHLEQCTKISMNEVSRWNSSVRPFLSQTNS